jgi:hydroxylamine reductase (hybrid-cluster protein)
MEKRFKKTDEFNFFVKDEIKRKILEVSEFVESYVKKKYPKVKFEIVLDYDGIDEDIVMDIVFEKTSLEKGMMIVKDVRKRIRDKFIKLPLPITILASWGN